ncbi:DUF6600 domain-containing protein [Edaphobacter bradus]|uniref:DUF6600 domain-containing protein n=1 Tax=Edaphobacter bradus TaxID=2259016 RepID=UPI0021E0A5AA|nr:DUF6600 domain-containing protein [Edaphobacter bradus]
MKGHPWLRSGVPGWGIRRVLIALVLAGASTLLWAEAEGAHRTARLSYVQGSVKVDLVRTGGSYKAQLNMPLSQGQRIRTEENGQAEVEFEDGSVVRLTPYSTLSLDTLKVDEGGNFQTHMSVVGGLVYAELRASSTVEYRLAAGGDVITPLVDATVRVNLDQPPALIAVFSGAVHVERVDMRTGGYRTDVQAGQSVIDDSSSPNRFLLIQQIAEDSWDTWNADRDQAAADQAAARTSARDGFAGNQGYGWSDLDTYGTWYDVPGQGLVWQPTAGLDSGFDPYGYGSWVWSSGLGYLWASGYPWGWTPYRCGNWSYWGGFGWGWAPGIGCGFGGWGFGGVSVINIGRPPLGYRPPTVPVRGPQGVHPIVSVGRLTKPTRPLHAPEETRTIAGQIATPLHPVGGSEAFQSGNTGAALRRDFPVDRTSHPGSVIVTGPSVTGQRQTVPNMPVQRQPYSSFRSGPAAQSLRPAPIVGHIPAVEIHGAQAPMPHPSYAMPQPYYAPPMLQPHYSAPPMSHSPAGPSAPSGGHSGAAGSGRSR